MTEINIKSDDINTKKKRKKLIKKLKRKLI